MFLDIIPILPSNHSLEEDEEGSFSGSPSDVEPDGSIESVRRFFAETLGLGLLGNLVKEKPSVPVVSCNFFCLLLFIYLRLISIALRRCFSCRASAPEISH